MRITNVMMSNSMLGNINRNMNQVNRLFEQISTGSLINRPSDNPLMASRALRFSNTQSQIAQHQRNVNQANSWTEITEQAFSDLDTITRRISDLLLQADGAESFEDKQKIATEVNSLIDELTSIMNKTFGGRHIFSGLRTDQPPFFNRDQPDLAFTDITQNFNRGDIENTYVLDRSQSPAEVISINRIRLAHNGNEGSVRINGVEAQPVPRNPDGSVNYSVMSDDGIYHNAETGEVFFGDNAEVNFPMEVMYDQTGFKRGDLNPVVFFTATDSEGRTFTMDNQTMEFEFGVNTRIPINSLGKDVVTAQMFAELKGFVNDILNMELTSEQELRDRGLSDDEIRRYMQEERDMLETVTNDRFNNLIGRMDLHNTNISVQHTDLGTRMGRIEIINDRLEDDAITFEELATNNHGADIAELMIKLTTAQVALTASMQVGMNNMLQTTLLNFL